MNTMHDIPEMTVRQHHLACLGILSLCYAHIPVTHQQAVREAFEMAKDMGLRCVPENLGTSRPVCPEGPESN